jgi:hypothetical protein
LNGIPKDRRLDVLDNQGIEDLKTVVVDRLNTTQNHIASSPKGASGCVYLICVGPDLTNLAPIQESLLHRSLEVRLPCFEGDAQQIREWHFQSLKECDGVLVFWGQGKEGWLQTMLRDLDKAFGLGRATPYKAKFVYLANLPDAQKEGFRTTKVSIIREGAQFEPGILQLFIDHLSAA